MDENQIADRAARAIHEAFHFFDSRFKEITLRAKSRFESRDWPGMQKDALERLEVAPFGSRLGPHKLTHAWAGLALHIAAWCYGTLVYLVLRDTETGDADAWHTFFWPLVQDCDAVTRVRS